MASFAVSGKVAIVTGAAAGIGLSIVQLLLDKGVKGVTVVDICNEADSEAIQELRKNYASSRILYVQADTSKYSDFDEAFKQTISKFNQVDILINNAGILDDRHWQREVEVNVKGTINGIILGLEHYMPEFKSGAEGVIMNTLSIGGVNPEPAVPIYCATKMAVHGLTLAWGSAKHYERTRVRMVGIAPGGTSTDILSNLSERVFKPEYKEILYQQVNDAPMQTPAEMAPHAISVIENAPSGTVWMLEGGQPPYKFQLPDRFKSPKVFLEKNELI